MNSSNDLNLITNTSKNVYTYVVSGSVPANAPSTAVETFLLHYPNYLGRETQVYYANNGKYARVRTGGGIWNNWV